MASQILSFLILFLTTCANYVNGGSAPPQPQFGYLGPDGPQEWGSLSPTYSACSNGKFQSPINIVKSKCVPGQHLKSLDIEYHFTANATLVDNLFNVAMNYDGNAGVLKLDGKNYTLTQMHWHWHSPSEHHLNGIRYDAELHLVHKSFDGGVTVIAVLYHYGHPDPLLSKIQSQLEQLVKAAHSSTQKQAQVALGAITTKEIRKHSRKYYKYVGSFSTPPCTEGVIWHILGKVKSISKKQVEELKAPLIWECRSNSRPIQPLDGREVEMYDDDMNHVEKT